MPINTYYKYPLQLSRLMEGKEAPTCDLGASISKNIELIIMTRFGEHRSDPTYGCEIWDVDFELIVSRSYWEKKLRDSIHESINKHEPRLSSIDVAVVLSDIEKLNAIYKHPEIRKKVEIRLKAIVKKTGEAFNFTAGLFLSPLSLD
jgi:phage baseplate assembly protein W